MSSSTIRWVKNLSHDNLACRVLRHAWLSHGFRRKDPEDKTHTSGFDQVIVRHVQCMRCGTGRVDYYGRGTRQFNSPFTRITSRYLYPADYRWEGDEEGDRPQRDHFLWEEFRRGMDIFGEINA